MAPWFGLLSGAEREVGVAGPTVLMGHPHHLFRASIINTLIHRRGGFFGTRISGEIRQKISPCVSAGRTVSLFRFFLGFAQVSECRAQVREVTHLGSTNFFQCIAVGWHGSSTDEDHDFWLEVLTQESQFRLQP
jgi:hypothetical protein